MAEIYAFPSTDTKPVYHPGMSLRDWFAGQALMGMAGTTAIITPDQIARAAYGAADAMLRARTQHPQPPYSQPVDNTSD